RKHRDQNPPAVPPTMTAVGYKHLPGGLPVAEQPEPDRRMMTPFTLNEIRHVFALFTEAVLPPAMITWWSDWRRGHQARARYYHYQTRIYAAQSIARQAAAT
ncbi:transposase, partial [Frankia sp. ACN1ag]